MGHTICGLSHSINYRELWFVELLSLVKGMGNLISCGLQYYYFSYFC